MRAGVCCARSELGLYEEAVNLALEWGAQNNDYSLAKQNAKLPQDDGKKKQLWLRIAEHIISRQARVPCSGLRAVVFASCPSRPVPSCPARLA